MKAIAKNNGKLLAIASKSEKEQPTIAIEMVDRAITLERAINKRSKLLKIKNNNYMYKEEYWTL